MNGKLLGLATTLVFGLASGTCLAVPMQIDFSAVGANTSISGTGYVVVDSTLLVGPKTTGTPTNLSGLDAMQLSLTGIPTLPNQTIFTKADLAGWILKVDATNVIMDLNFFMSTLWFNVDWYQIIGAAPFGAVFNQLVDEETGESEFVDAINFSVTSVRQVSEPATLALFGLGLAGLGAVRRKKLAA